MKLIDKVTVVAEIERRIDEVNQIDKASYEVGLFDAYKNILSFLDILEVKEIGVDFGDPEGDIGVKWVQEEPASKDLEEAATKYARKQLSNPDYPTYNDEYEMECAFEAGAQWQKTKAYEWLKEHKEHPLIGCEDPCLSGYLTDEFIEDFKKAMEE